MAWKQLQQRQSLAEAAACMLGMLGKMGAQAEKERTPVRSMSSSASPSKGSVRLSAWKSLLKALRTARGSLEAERGGGGGSRTITLRSSCPASEPVPADAPARSFGCMHVVPAELPLEMQAVYLRSAATHSDLLY